MQLTNDAAWRVLFERHAIPERVDADGLAYIDAVDIKVEREPRLMAKFDHAVNLPAIFKDYGYSILPVARGRYVVGPLDTYQPLTPLGVPPKYFPLPDWIESLTTNHVSSETLLLNCALAAGMLNDFLGENELVPTVSGRMASGQLEFSVQSRRPGSEAPFWLQVDNAQVEVDLALEGANQLALVEAKMSVAEDFLVRQLFYPFRTWADRVRKPISPLYVAYTNGKYCMWRYEVGDPGDYNSLSLAAYQEYILEHDEITAEQVESAEPTLPDLRPAKRVFPQADSFERVINLMEVLDLRPATLSEIYERYAFDSRQADYYASALAYLGLAERTSSGGRTYWTLNSAGKQLMDVELRERNIQLAALVLREQPFRQTYEAWEATGELPSRDWIAQRVAEADPTLSGSTPGRRAASVVNWVRWVRSLTGAP
ncbi:MAG: hypothetical protein NVV57_01460 [Demequina sp.]|nr:hypothetical protein [Demequina sp.]